MKMCCGADQGSSKLIATEDVEVKCRTKEVKEEVSTENLGALVQLRFNVLRCFCVGM